MSCYRGQLVALATRHGKQRQVGPVFGEVLGAGLVVPRDVDTDRFGTFSGEVPRAGPALATARAKARLGMRTAGLRLALASAASYQVLPGFGCCGHEELLLFLDDMRGLEVVERHLPVAHRLADGPAARLLCMPACRGRERRRVGRSRSLPDLQSVTK